MKLSMQMTMVAAAIFGSVCLAIAIQGFLEIGDITDPALAADARGYAWFWAFLGAVAVAMAVAAWWMTRAPDDNADS